MSAFVVSPENMHRAVTMLIGRHRYGGQRFRTFAGIDTTHANAGSYIGTKLYALNINAVTIRYPDCLEHPENLPGPIDQTEIRAYRYRPSACTRIEGYKALGCLLYQCCEGDVPEMSETYHALKDAYNTLAHEIVSDLPEYDRAEWDAA